MKNFDYKNENGRSMIEMLGVLAIIGVLSVGGISGYSKAMQKYRINKTIEQITLIAGNIRTFFGSQRNYAGVYCYAQDGNGRELCYSGCNGAAGFYTNGSPKTENNGCPVIKKAKIVPDDMITSDDEFGIKAITNPFGYGVSLSYANKSLNNDYKAFMISYWIDNDQETCIDLLTQDWSTLGQTVVAVERCSDGTSGCADKWFIPPANIDDAVNTCDTLTYFITSFELFIDIDVNSTYWQSRINPSS